jgi:UDP-glucose 4-epimerase
MVKALVTGGAGFIGSHLVDRLLADNHEVTVVDNAHLPWRNLAHQDHNAYRALRGDVTNWWEAAGFTRGMDWVFHLAGIADIIPSIHHPLKYHTANVNGTINMLQASHLDNVKRFIYAASSSCYGIPDLIPTPERAAIQPRYPYALTKYIGELYVRHWAEVYKLPALSLRLFNVYGPRSGSNSYGAVISTFMAQKLANQPFTVVGDGTQTRDFVYVTDVVDAFIRAAEADNITGEFFNIGSANETTINRLAALLEPSNIVYIPWRSGEPRRMQADILEATNRLGWKPSTRLLPGLRNVLDNIDHWKDSPVWSPEDIESATKIWEEALST